MRRCHPQPCVEEAATDPSSILFPPGRHASRDGSAGAPAVAVDLHLDEIAGAVAAARQRPELRRLFLTTLRDADAVTFRQEVFRDLEAPASLAAVKDFAREIRIASDHAAHAARIVYRHERDRWLVEAASAYCQAVAALSWALDGTALSSRALTGFGAELRAYVASAAYRTLAADTSAVLGGLAALTYRLDIEENRLTVSRADGESDYGAEILATFARFRQPGAVPLPVDVFRTLDMNAVEVGILERVARLYPAVFGALDAYAAAHREFMDPVVALFADEIEFYLAYLEVTGPIRRSGLPFCLPEVSSADAGLHAADVFDLALALKRVPAGDTVVTNDVALDGAERILVITGPNQGGKTTLARALGQLHHLAAIGVPVPARAARVHLADAVHTHFDRVEDRGDSVGRLEADLRRARAMVEAATAESLVIMNEAFASTTVDDALALTRAVLGNLADRGAACVVVTFLDELATFDASTVSMAATADPADPALRTFRFERRAPTGVAYARTIADKHGLGYQAVRDRVSR